ncbi:MAG: hypothetical protein JKY22_08275 [Flavobacteriaceae bacterium]|nr:hypothetical protein [Flavobacteriaceae bacterium]
MENDYEIWDTIVKSSKWNTYHKSQRLELGSVYGDTPEDIIKVADSVPNTINRDSLITKLTRFSKTAEFTTFTLMTSNGATKGAFVIEIEGVIDSPENVGGIPLQWLFRANSSSVWYPIQLPNAETGTSIIDIISISPTEAFIVTDTHGFFLTEDGGRSWREANFGETNLGNGQLLKTIVAGTPSQVYCLVDRNTSFSDGENALYRFIRRSWIQRWKAGLVRILQ